MQAAGWGPLAEARNAALEEAAGIAEEKSRDELTQKYQFSHLDEDERELSIAAFSRGEFVLKNTAAAIRALKTTAPEDGKE